MRKNQLRPLTPAQTDRARRIGATSVGAAVFAVLYGAPHVALCDEPATSLVGTMAEVTVTANRREQTVEEIPYGLTVVGTDQLDRTGVTDIASLANQVPGLSLYDLGARFSGQTTPIIRGLNATGAPASNSAFRTFEQSPVGMYIGNSPIDGYFQLDDVSRIEVLRGPQGTLYGAGALGGAIRVVPNAPELSKLSGRIELDGGAVAHASTPSYAASGTLNVPVGDTFAFRVSGKFDYQPGFIDVFGILERPGPALTGIPSLANPADPVNSPGIYQNRKDWNDQRTFTGRASGLWKPTDSFTAELAFVYSHLNGDGGPTANTQFPGGPYPIDPRITFPSGGDYQAFSAVDQPFSRTTTLTSLDLSQDVGFATVSSTSSYYTTKGSTVTDLTYAVWGLPVYNAYYAGFPRNPRFVDPDQFDDTAHTFTQEVRLVSNSSPGNTFDYVLGLFYEKQERIGIDTVSTPGTPEYSLAEGCTGPYFVGGDVPDCLTSTGPGDVNFFQRETQRFEDKSVFGELTWHVTPQAQITAGGRHFKQTFTDEQSWLLYTFPTFLDPVPRSSPASKNSWKLNSSYEFQPHHFVYATWSQGFRRGGANTLPPTGIFKDSPLLETYAPDRTDNYEIGVKGRFSNGLTYALTAFDIEWDKPQIAGQLPDGNLAVINADKARSRGIELESSGPLWLPDLQFLVGLAYSDAKLTRSFSLPANDGTGNIVPGLISGAAGQQLPGSPKLSTAVTLIYDLHPVPGYDLSLSVNHTYRSHVPLGLKDGVGSVFITPTTASSFGLLNFSATLTHLQWQATGYVTNLTDKRADVYPGVVPASLEDPALVSSSTINRPRVIGVRLGYHF